MVDENKPPIRLDLACGQSVREGFTGVDLYSEQAAIKHDLEIFPWPFEDNSVDEVYCCHYIEHCKDLIGFWAELYRILKPDAKANIIAPYGKHNRAWQDPSHVRAIMEESFLYLDRKVRENFKITHYFPDIHFEFVVTYHGIDAAWANRSEEARAFAIRHYWNVVTDIQAILTKK